MATHEISATVHADAPPELVWEVLADAPGYAAWSHLDGARYEREGTPAPHGAGAIRVFTSGRYTLREEVTGFLPGRRLDYELLSGMPVRGYVSRVTLGPLALGGTTIHWRAEFRPTLPGTGRAIARSLERSLDKLARALAAEAERRYAAVDAAAAA